jgi:hypothetical protein
MPVLLGLGVRGVSWVVGCRGVAKHQATTAIVVIGVAHMDNQSAGRKNEEAKPVTGATGVIGTSKRQAGRPKEVRLVTGVTRAVEAMIRQIGKTKEANSATSPEIRRVGKEAVLKPAGTVKSRYLTT